MLNHRPQDWVSNPAGSPGWAIWFVSHGYQVYLIDAPYRGRSPWTPAIDDVVAVSAEKLQSLFTACKRRGNWPQARFHTQWPGRGEKGDPIFDKFFASSVQMIRDQEKQERATQAALVALLDRIRRPVVLVSHSNSGGVALLVADVRPTLVEMIVSLEPKGPPFSGGRFNPGSGNKYGLCQAPITYDPPVKDPLVDLVQATKKAASPDLMDAIIQAESPPPRKLVHLTNIPVLVVTAQASYHAQYDWCSVEYLRQAGVQVEHLKLWEKGILGNGHMMFMENNSYKIAAEIDDWIGRCSGR